MDGGGMMIRLIDVVLILLFGFISISEVSDKADIHLPTSKRTPIQSPAQEEIVVVGITQQGLFILKHGRIQLESTEELEQYLTQLQTRATAAGGTFRVRVRPHKDTPIRYTMQVASICDKLHIPKGIDVKKIEEKQG